MISISTLNDMSDNDAMNWFMQTCTASRWCQLMTNARPFSSLNELIQKAETNWLQMQTPDYLEAFEGHPMIGDLHSLRAKYANTKALASNEQAGTAQSDEATLKALQSTNIEYLNKHGFIFIICATGLSAKAMLLKLQQRLPNSTEVEMKTAAKEQLRISLLRIEKAIKPTENNV